MLDFVNNIYERNGALYPSFADLLAAGGGTFTRSTGGYDLRASEWFDIDEPRVTNYGLLLEPAATNLIIQSKFASGWSGDGAAVGVNNDAAPDATTTAARITENDAISNYGVVRQQGSTALSAQRYVFSSFAKIAVGSRLGVINIFDNGFAAQAVARYNLGTGAVDDASFASGTGWSAGVASVQAAAQSYWRLVNSFVPAAGTGLWVFPIRSYNGGLTYDGDTTSAMSVWGAQLEAAAVSGYFLNSPSSFFPTTTAAAARGADALSLAIPDGLTSALVAFDNDATQAVNGLSGTWNVPTTLDRPLIKSIVFS